MVVLFTHTEKSYSSLPIGIRCGQWTVSRSDGSHFLLQALGATVGLRFTMLFPLCPLTVTMFEMMAVGIISDWILGGGDLGHCSRSVGNMWYRTNLCCYKPLTFWGYLLQSITYLSVLTDKPSDWLGSITDTSCLLSEDKILDYCVHEMLSNEKKEDYDGDSEKFPQSLIREDSLMWDPDNFGGC